MVHPRLRPRLPLLLGHRDGIYFANGTRNNLDLEEVRVLVVDDSADAAETLATLLTLNGYAVKTAADGLEALDVVARFDPHCVIFDINMPNLDGLQLATKLRQQHCDHIVLIAITGASVRDSRVAATFSMADHYLLKPVDSRKLAPLLPPISNKGAANY